MADNKNRPIQQNPSTAYLDERGNYVPCPVNQPLAYSDRSVHSIGSVIHPFGKPGYCAKHKALGCTQPECR